jgi:hypothetical protein
MPPTANATCWSTSLRVTLACLAFSTVVPACQGGFGVADAIALIAVLVAALALPMLAIVISRRERVPMAA